VHLFLIPLEPANGDSQMIFVLAKHTPFAAGAKRRNRARKIHQISKKSRVGRGPSRVGSALVGVAERKSVAKTSARIHRCARPRKAHVCNHASTTRSYSMCRKSAAGFPKGHATEQESAARPVRLNRNML
jgi:hypothetical protein